MTEDSTPNQHLPYKAILPIKFVTGLNLLLISKLWVFFIFDLDKLPSSQRFLTATQEGCSRLPSVLLSFVGLVIKVFFTFFSQERNYLKPKCGFLIHNPGLFSFLKELKKNPFSVKQICGFDISVHHWSFDLSAHQFFWRTKKTLD